MGSSDIGAERPAIRVGLVAAALTGWGLSALVRTDRALRLDLTAAGSREVVDDHAVPQLDILVVDLDSETDLDAMSALTMRSGARLLLLTSQTPAEKVDTVLDLGAAGLFQKTQEAETFLHAIHRIHAGELWLDRRSAGLLVMKLAQAGGPVPHAAAGGRLDGLTIRERHIARAFSGNRSGATKAIARELGLSVYTVRNHLSSIYGKLGVRNRVELLSLLRDLGYS